MRRFVYAGSAPRFRLCELVWEDRLLLLMRVYGDLIDVTKPESPVAGKSIAPE